MPITIFPIKSRSAGYGQLAPAWSSASTYLEEAIGEANGLMKQVLNWSHRHLPFTANGHDDKAA